MSGTGPLARVRAATVSLTEWMRERRALAAGLLPEPGQLRRVDGWVEEAGAALRQLSADERSDAAVQADIAEYKKRLGELQVLLREIETQARMRRSELQTSAERMKAVARWAKSVREIG